MAIAPSEPPSESFDYVIVGGGTAGLVVAARLSEDPAKTIAVIEAGANRKGDPRIDVPGLMGTLYEDPAYDWSYITEPQTALNGRQIACPRGKVLGGTSALNFSAILYPSKADFNDWAALTGDAGWNAEAFAPYLRKFQTWTPASEQTKKQLRLDYMEDTNQGNNGPLNVTIPDGYGPFHEAWVNGFSELGHHSRSDPIGGENLGSFTSPLSIHPERRTREYAASSYFTDEVAQRPNLHVFTETTVEKIEFADEGEEGGKLRATGAKIIRKDGSRGVVSVKEDGELILSAGSIQSPQLLELSGIGDEKILKQHGIPVKLHNAGVGENLQDHTISTVSYEIAEGQMSADTVQRDASLQAAVMKMFQDDHNGPLAGTLLSIAYLPPVDKNGAVDRTELQTLIQQSLDAHAASSSPYADFPARKRQYELLRKRLSNPQEPSVEFMYLPMQLNNDTQRNTMQYIFGGKEAGDYVTLVAILNHPFSRGSVHIRSADPHAAPAIDPRYLSHPLDLELQARHVQYFEQLVATQAMKGVLKEGGRRVPADKDSSDLATAKEIAAERAFTCFHPSGTCAMMPRELDGVVDTRLMVYGTRNLRVVDASVFPLETLGNIQATVYAVAEKAADMIREDAASR